MVDFKLPKKLYCWVHLLVEVDISTLETKLVKGYVNELVPKSKSEDKKDDKSYNAKNVGEVVL